MTMMTKEQIEALKPCPFCGESFVYVVAGQIECHQCGARGPQALREHQRQAWNRRAALAASPEVIREAEARGMERAADTAASVRTRIANGPMPEGARFDYEQAIRAEAAALRGEKEPK